MAKRALKALYDPDGLVLLRRPHRHQFDVLESRCITCGCPRWALEDKRSRFRTRAQRRAQMFIERANEIDHKRAFLTSWQIPVSMLSASNYSLSTAQAARRLFFSHLGVRERPEEPS